MSKSTSSSNSSCLSHSFSTSQRTCQDTEQSPNLTINHLPDEMLLEIFDSYRQITDQYDHQWRKKHVWFNLTHVCRKWRAIMFASSSRLDLGITVGPQKPGHIKTILSSPLPIFIDYKCLYGDITGSALWRLRSALRQQDRVREISFEGSNVGFKKFFKATKRAFPILESLVLRFGYDYEQNIPDTFLRGEDLSDLHVRRLSLDCLSLTSVSGLLLSATALTDLSLLVDSISEPSAEITLLTCLRGMHCLRNLDLSLVYGPLDSPPLQHSAPKDVVQMSELTRFHYIGHNTFLNNLMAGFSAPSLQDVRFMLCNLLPILHLPRFIDGLREQYRSVNVTLNSTRAADFRLSLLTHFEDIMIDDFKPSFRFHTNHSPESIKPISSISSTKLAAAEELTLFFPHVGIPKEWEHVFPLREFLRQFRSVKVLRVDPFVPEVALALMQDNEGAVFPVLEEIELLISRSTSGPDEEHRRRRAAEELGAFEPFVSVREQAGRPVKVSHRELPRSD